MSYVPLREQLDATNPHYIEIANEKIDSTLPEKLNFIHRHPGIVFLLGFLLFYVLAFAFLYGVFYAIDSQHDPPYGAIAGLGFPVAAAFAFVSYGIYLGVRAKFKFLKP